eukprot:3110154-Rhodomonas_salina.2
MCLTRVTSQVASPSPQHSVSSDTDVGHPGTDEFKEAIRHCAKSGTDVSCAATRRYRRIFGGETAQARARRGGGEGGEGGGEGGRQVLLTVGNHDIGVCCYGHPAMPRLVRVMLTRTVCYALSGSDIGLPSRTLPLCDVQYRCRLCCYATRGTDIGYAAMRCALLT